MTRDDFLDDPNAYFYCEAELPDEWIAAAWEAVPEFRENITYGISRYVSKGFETQLGEIECLARALPLHRMVELYHSLRDGQPWDEPAFRPAFEQVFGERMAAFPPALTDTERETLSAEYAAEPPDGERPDDPIPF